MTAAQVAIGNSFFNEQLFSSKDQVSGRLSPEAWAKNLQMAIDSAIHLASLLQEEMRIDGPRKETMRALYDRVVSLSIVHEPRAQNDGDANYLSKALKQAREVTEGWYLGCIDPKSENPNRIQLCPTNLSIAALIDTLQSLASGEKSDLTAAAMPFFERHNAGLKQAQVFQTPLELFEPGQPLHWMAAKP